MTSVGMWVPLIRQMAHSAANCCLSLSRAAWGSQAPVHLGNSASHRESHVHDIYEYDIYELRVQIVKNENCSK